VNVLVGLDEEEASVCRPLRPRSFLGSDLVSSEIAIDADDIVDEDQTGNASSSIGGPGRAGAEIMGTNPVLDAMFDKEAEAAFDALEISRRHPPTAASMRAGCGRLPRRHHPAAVDQTSLPPPPEPDIDEGFSEEGATRVALVVQRGEFGGLRQRLARRTRAPFRWQSRPPSPPPKCRRLPTSKEIRPFACVCSFGGGCPATSRRGTQYLGGRLCRRHRNDRRVQRSAETHPRARGRKAGARQRD